MTWQLSIIVFNSNSSGPKNETFNDVVRKVLASKLDKDQYEMIFVGRLKDNGKVNNDFKHVVVRSERPLIRAFYDNFTTSKAFKINSIIKEAHCPMILLWPGLCFLKSNFKPIPEDVVDCEYYLMLWLRFQNSAEDWPWWFDFKGNKPEYSFGDMKYKANVKDTIRFIYCLDKLSWRCKVWYFGWLLIAMWRGLLRRNKHAN